MIRTRMQECIALFACVAASVVIHYRHLKCTTYHFAHFVKVKCKFCKVHRTPKMHHLPFCTLCKCIVCKANI